MSMEKQDYHKASNAVVFGGVITFAAGLLLLMSFSSPYWIASYRDSFSDFKNMGLWQYCFKEFRFPYYQFDRPFDGCHHIYSQEYYVIREWLLPGWLLVVQTFVTLALLLSFFAQFVIAMSLIRYPLKFVLRYEWLLSAVSFGCDASAAVFLFLAVAIFGGQCHRRDWLMYPHFNYLSWSYAFAVIASLFHGIAGYFLYLDARAGYSRRKESRNLIMQMQTNPQSHGLHRSGYI